MNKKNDQPVKGLKRLTSRQVKEIDDIVDKLCLLTRGDKDTVATIKIVIIDGYPRIIRGGAELEKELCPN